MFLGHPLQVQANLLSTQSRAKLWRLGILPRIFVLSFLANVYGRRMESSYRLMYRVIAA